MTQDKKNQIMPLLTALMFAGAIFLALRSENRVFQNTGQLKIREESDAVVLEWRSNIDVPMARRFEEAYAEWGNDTGHFIIDLNSPGGALIEGEAVIRVIERMKHTHRVDTRVRSGRACFSMCVPIFLQGEARTAAPSARFMFHEPSSRDYFTGEEVNAPGFEKRRATARFVERYFTRSPMDPEWRDELVSGWQGKDVFKTGRELVSENSGIVTRLE